MLTKKFLVKMYRDAAPSRGIVEVGNHGARVLEQRWLRFGYDVVCEFEKPRAEVVAVQGGGRYVFKSGAPPVWWVRLIDEAGLARCDLECRNRYEAYAVAKACDRASGRERKKP